MDQKQAGYIVMDVETTITQYMKRKASPFTDENWIVAAGHKVDRDPVAGHYWGVNQIGSRGYLKDMLATYNPRYLVGFNFKFDLLWLCRFKEDYEAYMQWVADGGQVWDVQLAEYLLDGMVQESQMLSLDEVAPRYGGETKIDEVKAMWARGINTPDIPRKLLMDYLLGRPDEETGETRPGDIQNTELCFLGQLKAARQSGQLKSIQLNNGALVATVEMERSGLYVNIAKGREQAAVLAAESVRLAKELTKYLPDDLPFEFKWSSRKQLSAFIFGGHVKYKQRVHQVDEAGAPAYSKKKVEAYVLEGGTVMECDWWEHCYHTEHGFADDEDMSRIEYKSGKKKGTYKTKQVDVNDHTKPKLKWEDFLWPFKGLTVPKKSWESDSEKGVYSTASAVIEELGLTTDIPFLKDFANLAAISKDLGTYYIIEEFDEETGEVSKAKGMLTLVQPDGIVHHKVNMTSTVTARMSHSDPNAGNLPRGDDNSAAGLHTSLVKEMFESRWLAEGGIISSDFKSLEVYCQANLSHDPQLIKDLRDGLDMHCMRLSVVENVPYEEVLLRCKGNKRLGIPKIDEWDVKRTHIKTFSFQRAYGAGSAKIAQQLKVSKETVDTWVVADDKRYAGIPLFNEKVQAVVNASRVATGKWVLHPTEKQSVQLSRGSIQTFDGKKYVFQESTTPDYIAKRGTLSGFVPTELKNYPVQGLGGEWMKAAMWLAVRLFYKYKNFGGLAHLINTVHDALYADSHLSVQRKVGVAIHASMLAASDFMEYWFGKKIDVPVPSETTYGSSMAQAQEFDDPDQFDAQAHRVRVWLRNTYMGGFTPSF